MRLFCLVVIVLIANTLATAQTIILRDTVRLRDSSAIVTPLEPSAVAKKVRGIVDNDNDGNAPRHRNFLSDSIKSDGFVSQSFASGNRRDLSPNTTADLRLSAKIAGGITIDAEILDSDMPMDDDGVTNQINELSTVRISAAKDSTRLSIGDIVAVGNDNSLARFSKKIKLYNRIRTLIHKYNPLFALLLNSLAAYQNSNNCRNNQTYNLYSRFQNNSPFNIGAVKTLQPLIMITLVFLYAL